MMNRRICVVTGTRAEYGLLRWVMDGIRKSPVLELQVVATGMHLSPEFGLTYREIENDGFRIDRRVEMLLSSDSPVGLAKSMGLGMIGFADALCELRPDMLLVLGDRFEIFSAVAASIPTRIPVAHLHGGETTEGAIDESFRHSMTKMSHLHFVATEEYRKRVIQLGEQPDRVFCVGGLGVDGVVRTNLIEKEALQNALDFRFGPRNLLVTFHPVTLEEHSSERQMSELLAALEELQDTHIIFTMPNADTDGRVLFGMIEDFVATHPCTKAVASLGQLRYLSCVKYVDAVVGNSSSGLLEVPSFRKGTINIGDRQKGRIKADSVIDCEPEKASILKAMERLYSAEFQNGLQSVVNPYGVGGASDTIVGILETVELAHILKKEFYDIPVL